VGGGPQGSARIVTREALAPLFPLILHFVNLILPAKTPNYHVVRRTDTDNFTYTYDAANRVQGEQRNGTPDATYTYDLTDQLTGDGTKTYSYDANGNRTMAGYQTGTGNQLTNDGTWTYTYDNAGNMIQKSKGSGLETWYFGYDNANHATSMRQTSDGSTNQLTVTYTYDALGNRVQQDKWKSGGTTVTTRFVYDAKNVWADLDGANTLLARYLYGSAVDQILSRTVSGGQPNAGVAWYLTDRLGSVRDLENGATQAVGDHLDYDGFGNATQSAQSYGDRYNWTSREFDSDTQLQFNRARFLSTLPGRWISEDPSRFVAGDSNLYRYVRNQTQLLLDPAGLAPNPSPKTSYPAKVGEWGSYTWGITWHLDSPAAQDGYIVQFVSKYYLIEPYDGPVYEGLAEKTNYYEAWRVSKGNTETDLQIQNMTERPLLFAFATAITATTASTPHPAVGLVPGTIVNNQLVNGLADDWYEGAPVPNTMGQSQVDGAAVFIQGMTRPELLGLGFQQFHPKTEAGALPSVPWDAPFHPEDGPFPPGVSDSGARIVDDVLASRYFWYGDVSQIVEHSITVAWTNANDTVITDQTPP
jgi:RHS repeat-associated protein